MLKSESVKARLSPEIKKKAGDVLKKLGMSTSEAISVFLNQTALQKGLPFEVKIPNEETKKAMEAANAKEEVKSFSSVKELMADLES